MMTAREKKRWCMHNQLEKEKREKRIKKATHLWLVTGNDYNHQIW